MHACPPLMPQLSPTPRFIPSPLSTPTNDDQDTGGIFAGDWKTLEAEKMQLLHELQPAPSRLEETPDRKGLRYREGVDPAGTKEVGGACAAGAAGGQKKKGGGWFAGLFGKGKKKK